MWLQMYTFIGKVLIQYNIILIIYLSSAQCQWDGKHTVAIPTVRNHNIARSISIDTY